MSNKPETVREARIYDSVADFPPAGEYGVGPIRDAGGQEFWSNGVNIALTGRGALRNSDRRKAIFEGSPLLSNTSALDTLTTWLQGTAAIESGGYTNILFYDPINGSDGNVGTRQSAPKQNLPTNLAANTVYAVHGAHTVNLAQKMGYGAGSMLTSYDPDGLGRVATINGDTITAAADGDNARAHRVASANVTIANIKLTAPNGTGHGSRTILNTTDAAAGLKLLGVEFFCPSTGFFGRTVTMGALKQFTIESCFFNGSYNPLNLSDQSGGVPTDISRIRFNKFSCNNQQVGAPFQDDGDAITFDGINPFDWAYKLLISDNEITGFHENAVDLNKHSRIIVVRNDIHQLGVFQTTASTAIMMGSSSDPTSSSRNLILGNYIHDLLGQAVSTRGSQYGLVMGNIIANMARAMSFATPGSRYNKFIHNTCVSLIDQLEFAGQISVGSLFNASAVRFEAGMQNTEVFNNILHVKDSAAASGHYFDGIGNLTADSRLGQ